MSFLISSFFLLILAQATLANSFTCKEVFRKKTSIFYSEVREQEISDFDEFISLVKQIEANNKAMGTVKEEITQELKKFTGLLNKLTLWLSPSKDKQLRKQVKSKQNQYSRLLFKRDRLQSTLRIFIKKNQDRIEKFMDLKLRDSFKTSIVFDRIEGEEIRLEHRTSFLMRHYNVIVEIDGKKQQLDLEFRLGFTSDLQGNLRMYSYPTIYKDITWNQKNMLGMIFKRRHLFVGTKVNSRVSLASLLPRLGFKQTDPRALEIIEKVNEANAKGVRTGQTVQALSKSVSDLYPNGLSSDQSNFYYQYIIWYLLLSSSTPVVNAPPAHWFLHELNSERASTWSSFFHEQNIKGPQIFGLENLDSQIKKFGSELTPISETLQNPNYISNLREEGVMGALGLTEKQMDSVADQLYTPMSDNTNLTGDPVQYSSPEPTYSSPEPTYSSPDPGYSSPDPGYSSPDAGSF